MATDVYRNLFNNSTFGNGTSGVTSSGAVSLSPATWAGSRSALKISHSGASGSVTFSVEPIKGSEATVVIEAALVSGTAPTVTVSTGGSSFTAFPETMQGQLVEYKIAFTDSPDGAEQVTLTFANTGSVSALAFTTFTVVPALYYGRAFSGDSIHSVWEGEPDNSVAIQNPGHNSPTSWWINNIPLNSYAMSIESIGNDKSSVPAVRQSASVVPFRPGNIWREGITDARTQQLGLWLLGAESDGTVPRQISGRVKFQENLKEIQRRFWDPSKKLEIKKKIWVKTEELEKAGYPTSRYLNYGKMSLITLYNDNASFSTGLTPSMTGGSRAAMVMNFTLHDPFYYGVRQSVTLASGSNTVTVPGDAKTYRVYIKAVYGASSGQLKVVINGREFIVPSGTVSSATLNVDSLNFSATIGTNNFSAESKIIHTGSTFWLELEPGENTVELTRPTGSTVTLEYESAWF